MPWTLQRLLLLPSALLALTTSYVTALDQRDAAMTVTPAPLSIPPDENWDGIDGSWSSFTLRIGTPEQTVRVFLSTASYQTWAVLPEGCQSAQDPGSCEYQRGGSYDPDSSSTFKRKGIYLLWIEQNLGYNGNANFGQDTIGLAGLGENGPTVDNATVGGFAVDDFYLGVLGVNPKVSNWTSFEDWTPSLMTQLKEQKKIPSVSFSYTAGARYQSSEGVLASLTLGGYDSSKFIANDVEFTMAPDNDRDILVAIQSISTPSQIENSPNPTELLPNPIYAYIDSTVPQIWLPIEACLAFEEEFGLIYNNQTQLYLVNETLHDSLVERNASVTFTIAQNPQGGPTVRITLPYGAFDLTASPPYYGLGENTTYFPLRRAANDSQYTLGRTFLQEAYLTVDWEAQRFNVSEVSWDQSAQENLVGIPPFSDQQARWAGNGGSNSSSSNSLSGGAIAGIVVGVVVFFAILAGVFFWYFRRHKNAKAAYARRFSEKQTSSRPQSSSGNSSTTAINAAPNINSGQTSNVIPRAELQGSTAHHGYYEPDKPHNQRNSNLLSVNNSSSANTPPGTSWSNGDRTPIRNSALFFSSPASPLDSNGSNNGEGQNSNSSQSGQVSALPFSPVNLTPGSATAERRTYFPDTEPIYEMPGDMPKAQEKDGRSFSEKEAEAYRERKYNGTPPTSPLEGGSSNAEPTTPGVSPISTRTPIADMFTRRGSKPSVGTRGRARNWSLPRRISPDQVVPATFNGGRAGVGGVGLQRIQPQPQIHSQQPSDNGTQQSDEKSDVKTDSQRSDSGSTSDARQSIGSWSVTRARPFSFEDQDRNKLRE